MLHAADGSELPLVPPCSQPHSTREAKLHPCFCNIIECIRKATFSWQPARQRFSGAAP
jgi:hypothetical protein